jgi:hypothetical protein
MSTPRAHKRALSPLCTRSVAHNWPLVEGTPVLPTEPPAQRIKVHDVEGADPMDVSAHLLGHPHRYRWSVAVDCHVGHCAPSRQLSAHRHTGTRSCSPGHMCGELESS